MTRIGAQTLASGGLAKGSRGAGRILPCLLALLVVSCARTDTHLARASLATGVSAQQAIALPPPGGPAVVGIVERRYANAIQQDIALTTNSAVAGQNLLRVQVFGNVGREGGETTLVDGPLHEADLRREMRARLPGIAMQRSPLYAQNGYGPFGYATGRQGADLCLYAWQRIAGSRNGAPLANLGTIQVRIRICQTGASEQGLLAVMYGYTINASFSGSRWNPYGAPPPADPRLGRTGQPIVPSAASNGYETMLDPPRAPRAPRRVRPSDPAPPALPAPPPGAPVVPPPPAPVETPPVVPPPPAP